MNDETSSLDFDHSFVACQKKSDEFQGMSFDFSKDLPKIEIEMES